MEKDNEKAFPVGLIAELGLQLFKDQALQAAIKSGVESVLAAMKSATADLSRVEALERKVAALEKAIHLMVDTRVRLGQMEDPFTT